MAIDDFILEYEVTIRLGFFAGVFIFIAIWEIVMPKRVLSVSKPLRWLNNMGLVFLNTVIVRLLFPVAAVGVAFFVNSKGWGLLNYYDLHPVIKIIIAVTFMDLAIYLQHVMVHAIPALWCLHRVHHADLDYDVTTGARFHPIEIVLSMLLKFAVIIMLGAPAIAVVIFEVILNSLSMFNHGNISLPKRVDKILRWFVVTPDMHRIHHSIETDEANSNFGFNLSWWDRLFGTYRQKPRAGHIEMVIGINRYRDSREVSNIIGMLMLPFKGKTDEYTINAKRQPKSNDKESQNDPK